MKSNFYIGNPPENCDICKTPFTTTFIDGRTDFGMWANMCELCFIEHGLGLGTGFGQRYEKQTDGTFIKIGG